MTTLEKDKKYLIQCYTTDDIVFTKGKGMYMYDEDGKKYLDFSGQFSACTLGHGNVSRGFLFGRRPERTGPFSKIIIGPGKWA